MANQKLIDKLRKEALEISKEMAHSLTGYKRKGYLQGQLDQINKTLAELASGNGSSKNG
jgi:hypothetical protein